MTPLMNDLVLDRLRALDVLLVDETKWTHGVGAKTATGAPISPNDPQACCWCLIGGAYKIIREITRTGREADLLHQAVINALKEQIDNPTGNFISLAEFNDDADFPAIKRLISDAIQTFEGRRTAAEGAATTAGTG